MFGVILVHFQTGVLESLNNSSYIIVKIISLFHINGYLGVDLFLVLSTFLFTVLSDGGNRSIIYHKFMCNRMLRIFPLLVICLTIIFTMKSSPTSEDYFNLFTLNVKDPTFSTVFPFGLLWTVGIEFKFYIILPLLLVLLKKKGIKLFLLWILVLVIIKILMVNRTNSFYDGLYHSLIGRFDQFLIGIILGKLYLDGVFNFLKNKIVANIALIFSITILGGVLYWMYLQDPSNPKLPHSTLDYLPFRFTLQAIIMGMIMITYMYSTLFSSKIINNILRYLGSLTFSMYLFHVLIGGVILSYYSFTGTFSALKSIIFMILPLSILFAMLTKKAIEDPFLELKVNYFKD